jgi:ABC-2 type transport system permease protein
MMRAGTLGWIALHETRLAWRDWLSLLTAGHRRRIGTVVVGLLAFAVFAHGLAYLILHSAGRLDGPADKHVLVVVSFMLLLAWSMMLSQAMESVTRAFYARGDLDLILTSPVTASRLFAVRIAAMAVTILLMTLVLAAPFIDVLVWLGGAHWLGAYGVALALAIDSVAVAVVLTVAMFRAIGPKRTRTIAQVAAAVIGAAFMIGIQFVAINALGTTSRLSVLQMPALLRIAPDGGSALWWPARAVLGDPAALAILLGASVVALVATIRVCAPLFGQFALAVASVPNATRQAQRQARFRSASPSQVLRRKEWTLLLRDPWLISQTLTQLLYLLPPAFMLWRSFYANGGGSALLVPVLIVAAGQLSGGLAWLAVSGEDAPELVASAPVSAACVLRAKTEAVLGAIIIVFAPFVLLLAVTSPFAALVACCGIAIAASTATAIQFWFRTQARRSLFRRRQTSSRIATFAEALSSIGWAGTGALAATGTWLAAFPGVLVLGIVAGVWMLSPSRKAVA